MVQVGADAGVFEGLERGLAVHAGAFQRRRADAMVEKQSVIDCNPSGSCCPNGSCDDDCPASAASEHGRTLANLLRSQGRAYATLRRMTIETILDYLNAVPVRATFGAVGEVLGVRPQAVSRLLGARRPEASWIVNGSTGEPTGYTAEQVDPRLPGTHVIRSGDELRSCLERHAAAAAAPDDVSAAADAVAVDEAAEAGVAIHEAPGTGAPVHEAPPTGSAVHDTPDTEVIAMGGDAKWIIGTLVPVVLLVTGLLSAQIASVSGSLTTRIDDVNDRIDDLRTDLMAEIAGVRTGVDDVRDAVEEQIAVLRGEVSSIAARLPAAAPASDEADTDSVEAPDEAEPDAAAPAVDPDPQPEPQTDPAAPAANADPPRE